MQACNFVHSWDEFQMCVCSCSAVPEHGYVNSSGMIDLQLAPDYVEGNQAKAVFFPVIL
jgi:hypothetical protein